MVESLLFIEAGAGEKILRAGASQKWTGSATLNLYRTGMCNKKKNSKGTFRYLVQLCCVGNRYLCEHKIGKTGTKKSPLQPVSLAYPHVSGLINYLWLNLQGSLEQSWGARTFLLYAGPLKSLPLQLRPSAQIFFFASLESFITGCKMSNWENSAQASDKKAQRSRSRYFLVGAGAKVRLRLHHR